MQTSTPLYGRIFIYFGGKAYENEADFINEFSVEYGIPALTEGVQQLNGWQAVLYCRIRKIDSDKVRYDIEKEYPIPDSPAEKERKR